MTKLEDCRYVLNSRDVKDSYDFFAYGMETALCYECVTIAHCYELKFCNYCMRSSYLQYCDTCWGCENCFGCIGLKDGKYCIFNKQYSKEEYELLMPQIVEHMKKTPYGNGEPASLRFAVEYGSFFHEKFSIFPYEDTLAQDYFSHSTQEKDVLMPEGVLSLDTLPDLVSDTDFSIAQNIYFCSSEKKPFKFQKRELEFYKKTGVAVPRVSFEQRYLKRNELIPFHY